MPERPGPRAMVFRPRGKEGEKIGEMDSSWMAVRHQCAKLKFGVTAATVPEGVQDMNSTTVAIDLAKNVFELAVH